MDTEPVRVVFEFAGNIDNEIKKVELSVQALKREGASSFKAILADSEAMFNGLSENSQRLAKNIQLDLNALRQLRATMAGLDEAFANGGMTMNEYAKARAKTSIYEADLTEIIKRQVAELKSEKEAMSRAVGSIEEKRAAIANLHAEYVKLSAAEREGATGDNMRTQMQALSQELANAEQGMRNVASGTGTLLDAAKAMPGPLGGVAKGIQACTKAALTFIATPLGMTLAAIAAALAAVSSWFKRTVEGQNALRIASAAFNAVLNSMLDVIDNVGAWLWKAFTKPKEALNDLVNAIKDNLINRLNAIVDMGAAIGKIFSGDFTGGMYDFANAVTKFTTGVDDMLGKIGDGMDDINDKTQKAMVLADRQNKLGAARKNFVQEEARLSARIQELRDKAYNTSLGKKEQLQALREAEQLTNRLFNKQIAFQKEEASILEGQKALSHSNKEDLREVEEAKAKAFQLEAQRQTTLRGLHRQANMLEKSIRIEEDTYDEDRAILKAQQKAANDQIKLQQETEARRIDAMEEGYDKRMATIELQYEKEKQKIKEQAEELLSTLQEEERKKWEASNTQDPFVQTITTLPVEVQTNINIANAANEENRTAQTKKANTALLREFEDYYAKRERMEREFNAQLTALRNLRNAENAAEVDAAIAEAERQRAAALGSLDDEYQQSANAIQQVFKDMSDKSGAAIRMIADEAEAMLAFVQGGEYNNVDGAAFGLTEEQFAKLNAEWAASPELLENIRKGIKEIRNEADNLSNPFAQLAAGFKKVFSEGSKTKETSEGMNQITAAVASISKVVGQLGDAFETLGEATNNTGLAEAGEIINGVNETLTNTADAAATGFAIGGPWGAAIAGTIALATDLFSKASKTAAMNAQVRKQLEDINKQAMLGEMELDQQRRQRYDWTKKIGESELDYLKRKGEELTKQSSANAKDQEALWAQLQGESFIENQTYKHGTWFTKAKILTDWGSLAGKTFEEIEELAAQGKLSDSAKEVFEAFKAAKEEGEDLVVMQEEYLELVRETLTGTTYQGVVDGIVQGFMDGKRSAADFADTFEELMQGVVRSALNLLADEKMRQWYEDFAAMGEDGYTDDEIRRGKEDYLRIIGGLAEEARMIQEVTGISIGAGVQATQKGMAGMSQDTGDALDGKFTTMLIYEANIDKGVQNMNSQIAQSLTHLARIEDNTSYCRRLEAMDSNIAKLRAGIDAIREDGLKTKK
jgi:hypothetical protein